MDRTFLLRALALAITIGPVTCLRGQAPDSSISPYAPSFAAQEIDPVPGAEVHPLLRQAQFTVPTELPAYPATIEQMPITDGAPAVTLLGPNEFCDSEHFAFGQWSAQYLTGVLFTPYHYGIRVGHQIPMNFLMENVRLSCVVRGSNPDRPLLRGSTEIALEVHTMPIIKGPGTIVVGANMFARYNFFYSPWKRLVFYCQAGGGEMYSDSYLHPPTHLVSAFNFIIHFAGGCHYFVSPRLSLDVESDFYHYSNGGIVLPNVSINGTNAFFGLTYYFGRCR